MINKVHLTLAFLSLILIQTSAISVVNNVTVPSDILTNLFINEIQNSEYVNDTVVARSGNYNSLKCLVGLQGIIDKLPSLDVLRFFDSWGKFPSGILYGHLKDVGNFDQCIRTSVNVNDAIDIVKGQYCVASVPLMSSPLGRLPLSIGICVPDTCNPELLTTIFQKATANYLGGVLSETHVHTCQVAEKPVFEAKNIVGIVIFSTVSLLMVLSTAYDVLYTKILHEKPKPVLMTFSVITNGRKLFAINTTQSSKTIQCLTGIRVLSMAWVVYCHNYIIYMDQSLINLPDVYKWFKSVGAMHVLMATVSVDSFLLISGLLLAWIVFPELDKTKGKINVLLMYFHRYVRLTPPVVAVIIFYVSVIGFIGTGPYRHNTMTIIESCETNWWSTILYVANYVHPDNICIGQTWYLDVDTQLFILSPLIFIPLWKWGKKWAPVMIILSALSIGCVIVTYYTEGYSQMMGMTGDDQRRRTYVPTHTRYSVWLIGVGLGYFMHKNKNNIIHPSKWIQLLAWTCCFLVITAIIWGPYITMDSDSPTTTFEAAVYEALKRIGWAIALSWIIFSCHFGFGGVINSFLSHPFWQPFSRLTFSMYLVHKGVQAVTIGNMRTDAYFSTYQLILLFWSIFGVSLLFAIALTLSFESPVLVLEKALTSSGKSKQVKQENTIVQNGQNEASSQKPA